MGQERPRENTLKTRQVLDGYTWHLFLDQMFEISIILDSLDLAFDKA